MSTDRTQPKLLAKVVAATLQNDAGIVGAAVVAGSVVVVTSLASWSSVGPSPRLYACHARLPGIAPIPVRSSSPLGSTTSIPQIVSVCTP